MLNRLKVIVSTYHIVMKFLRRTGVRELRSNPKESY